MLSVFAMAEMASCQQICCCASAFIFLLTLMVVFFLGSLKNKRRTSVFFYVQDVFLGLVHMMKTAVISYTKSEFGKGSVKVEILYV